MAMIHCRIIDGVEKFRIWSTICDEYMSEEMTEEEVKEWLLDEALRSAKDQFEREFPQRMARAKFKGSSSGIDFEDYLHQPWEIRDRG